MRREPPSSPSLEYAAPPPWHWSRAARRVYYGVILLVIVILALSVGPELIRRSAILYWQQRCMHHTAAAENVVFSVNPPASTSTLEWQRFYSLVSPPGDAGAATGFLHERVSRNGQRRLVAVGVIAIPPTSTGAATAPAAMTVMLFPRSFTPATLLRRPKESTRNDPLLIDLDILYSGHPDPADESHFTIAGARAGEPIIIDGWLRDDGSVLLEPRRSPTDATSRQPQ